MIFVYFLSLPFRYVHIFKQLSFLINLFAISCVCLCTKRIKMNGIAIFRHIDRMMMLHEEFDKSIAKIHFAKGNNKFLFKIHLDWRRKEIKECEMTSTTHLVGRNSIIIIVAKLRAMSLTFNYEFSSIITVYM